MPKMPTVHEYLVFIAGFNLAGIIVASYLANPITIGFHLGLFVGMLSLAWLSK